MPDRPKVVSDEEWQQKCDKVVLDKSDLNHLVMNFLITEGYMDAAKAFEEESGTSCGPTNDACMERMEIRNAVESGRLDEAIERVNDLNPEILDEKPALVFRVQQQQLIEMIRAGKIEEALDFAQEYLAYKGEEDAALLDELESTIALVAFSDPSKCPVAHLLEMGQRQRTANELNAAILEMLNQEQEPRLTAILKILTWGQDKLAEKVSFPRVLDRPQTST